MRLRIFGTIKNGWLLGVRMEVFLFYHVQTDDCSFGKKEESLLGAAIFLHGLVIIEMFARHVGHHRNIAGYPPYPILIERMRRYLEHGMHTVRSYRFAQKLLQFQARKRRQFRSIDDFLPSNLEIDGRCHRHFFPRLLQDTRDKLRRSRLTIGSRHADNDKLLGRPARHTAKAVGGETVYNISQNRLTEVKYILERLRDKLFERVKHSIKNLCHSYRLIYILKNFLINNRPSLIIRKM